MFWFLLFLPLSFMALTAILNAFTFPRLRPAPSLKETPRISILVPMRNEARNIHQTVQSLRRQTYPALEILLLDDNSEDESAALAQQAAADDPRVRVLQGAPLPTGWNGKMWACAQLARQASGDYLLFTDADVRWQPGALSALMSEAGRTRAALLTAWPTQRSETWAERLVVPLMAFSLLSYLPALAVHFFPWPIFSAAMGQCLLFSRPAYEKIGGHSALPSAVLDDMRLAAAIKRQGLRLRECDANGFLETRMYHSWNEVQNGFAKNILAGHGGSVMLLALSTVFHFALLVLPWALIFFSPWPAVWLGLMGLLTRALTAATSRQRVSDSVWLPISALLMSRIAAQAIWWRFQGGPLWKGRRVTQEN